MPPSIDTMNITNSKIVRDAVGKISEAIRLAEEPAGDANRKRMVTAVYLPPKSSIW